MAVSGGLLLFGLWQLYRGGRTCRRRSRASIAIFWASAAIVLAMIVAPQFLANLKDVRVQQYWDPEHLLARRLAADARDPQPKQACCLRDNVLWDLAALYPAGDEWKAAIPPAIFFNGRYSVGQASWPVVVEFPLVRSSNPVRSYKMDTYLILLHESNNIPRLSPEEMQAIVARYKAWGQRLHASGKFVASNKLEDTGRVLRADAGKIRITDGPFTETKDVLGGYFVIQADNYEQAAELCRDSPHLDFGAVEIRRIELV